MSERKGVIHLWDIGDKEVTVVITCDKTIVKAIVRDGHISSTFRVTRYVVGEMHIKGKDEEKVIPIELHSGVNVYYKDDIKRAVQLVEKPPREILKYEIETLEDLKTLVNRLKESAYKTTEVQVEFEEV